MTIFNLPDLGEGLPDAEIREWYVQPNDIIKVEIWDVDVGLIPLSTTSQISTLIISFV